ncbi:DNA-binding response regulator, NarL/FixJ family, contains REC and HTH domains [Micromonospora viridifaciens]|uniref:DNA-binding response regulator, NarL/FixJ family, contains REC and HTH domains n=1 Tax=Micromonospora viridifaciens TaxID=1881 RepID=A0A1C4YZ98_MICVI|nr:response regulator transcription factor [Micromonospora viridifaciens]SCF26045.1 DNA-binding response regulator, NarL/FixJ family, contains REC and HTH domains [Micromonospora viridifaciens]
MPETVRVLLVDDHPIFLDGLRTALDGLPAIEVVGTATNGDAAVAEVAARRPDVVLMDLTMPGMSGVEATRRISARGDARVLVLTMHADDDSVYAAIRAGAAGYLLKGADRGDVARAVSAVAAGEAVFGTEIAQRVLRFFAEGPRSASARPFPELTPREVEVLDLVAQGLGNQAIARKLSIAPKTVRNSVSTILGKLHAADRGEAVARARAAGLGLPERPTATR